MVFYYVQFLTIKHHLVVAFTIKPLSCHLTFYNALENGIIIQSVKDGSLMHSSQFGIEGKLLAIAMDATLFALI